MIYVDRVVAVKISYGNIVHDIYINGVVMVKISYDIIIHEYCLRPLLCILFRLSLRMGQLTHLNHWDGN